MSPTSQGPVHDLKSLIGERSKPGAYRIGFWYHSDDVERIGDGEEPDSFSGNRGIYLAFDQLLFREGITPGETQGLAPG